MRWLNKLLDFVFPTACVGCSREGGYLCMSCLDSLLFLENQQCPGCRRTSSAGNWCSQRCRGSLNLDQLLVALEYRKGACLSKLLSLFKYKYAGDLADLLGGFLRRIRPDLSRDWLIVPVPLDTRKLKKRGFNQALLLAERLGGVSDLLGRKFNPESQAKLSRKRRLENVRSLFYLKDPENREVLGGKSILLVDDVATTGSTLDECARVLKIHGAKWVCGIVLARGR